MSIQVQGVSFVYSPGSPFEYSALLDVDCQIPPSALSAIVGPTGSGKTTLVQLLNGLERPSCGTIVVNGADITARGSDLRSLRCQVGLVFQYPEYQFFEETVARDVSFGPSMLNLSQDEIDRRVSDAMDAVGLPIRIFGSRSPFHLSGGEQRRVAIASVLAMDPQVLILDEPTAGLDFKAKTTVMNHLRILVEKSGKSVVIVTHDLSLVAERASHVILIRGGRVFSSGPVENFFQDIESLHANGIEVPPQLLALGMISGRGIDVRISMASAEESARFIGLALKG